MAGPKKAERKPVSPLPATWLPDVLAGSPAPRAPATSPVASPGSAAPVAGDVAFIRRVLAAAEEVIVYEPAISEPEFYRSQVTHDLKSFKQQADVIVANRITEDLGDVIDKVYSRDLFGGD